MDIFSNLLVIYLGATIAYIVIDAMLDLIKLRFDKKENR